VSVRSKTKEDKKQTTAGDDGGLAKVVKDMGVIGISKILLALSGVILLPILTRYLGADGYGIWVNVLATIGLTLPVLLLGFNEAIIRFFPSESKEDRAKNFFSILILVSTVTFIISIILFSYPRILSDLIFDGEDYVVRFLAVIIFVWCLDSLFLRTFQAFREMKKYATVNVLSKYTEIGLAIFLVVSGYGLIGALSAVLVVRTGLLIILFLYFLKRFGIRRPTLSRIKSLKGYFTFGAPLIPNSLSYWIITTSDRYLIAFFLGVTYVGYYAPGYTIGKLLPFMLAGMLYFVLKPTLSKYYDEGNEDRVKQIIKLSVKYILILTIPAIFGVLLFHYEITSLLSTDEIATEGSFIAIFTVFTGLIYALYVFNSLILILLKKVRVIASIKAIGAIMNISGNIILIPMIGIIGAAITTLVSYLFFTLSSFYITRKHIPITIDTISTVKIIFSSLVMYLSLYTLIFTWDIYFLYLIPLGILIYFTILISIRGITRKEMKFLKNL